jgi:hypothetical protein
MSAPIGDELHLSPHTEKCGLRAPILVASESVNWTNDLALMIGGTSMSTDVMKGRITETSPQVYARIGGVLYLIIIVIGFCSEFSVRDKLVSGELVQWL